MPDRETLYNLYRVDKIGFVNIARMYGVDRNTVQQWLIAYNIPYFSKRQSALIRWDRTQKNPTGLDIEYKEEPYLLMNFGDIRALADQGRITKIW